MKNRMCLAAAALALSMADFGLTGCDGEIKGTAAKTEAADRQVGGAQATDIQTNGDQAEDDQEGGSWAANGKRYKVVLCLSGTVNDVDWCQSAYDGFKLLEADYGCEATYAENLIPDDVEAASAGYATSGYDVVVGYGYEFGDPAVDVAEQYPDTKLAVTKGKVSADNVASYVSKCGEGRYIMGVLAADMPESGRVSFIGSTQGVSLVKIMNGFEDEVKEVDPNIQVQIAWTGSFTNTALGKEAAQAMIDNGADIIGHCANEPGTGAINAVEEAKVYATGDSCDQNDLAPDTIPSSSVYRIPHVIKVAFKTVADGTFEGDINQLGMIDGVANAAPHHSLDSAVPDELKQKISDKITAIESGALEVTRDTRPRTQDISRKGPTSNRPRLCVSRGADPVREEGTEQMPLLEMKHITKSFAGVYVNEGADLSVEQGEMHTLLREDGAGGVTLMNTLFGIYQADRGKICFKDRNVESKSPGEAVARGIGMVHQHFSLVKKMTMPGNVTLGLRGEGIMADRKPAGEKSTGLAAAYNLPVNPEAPVYTLSVGEQQRVEVLRTLYRDVSLLTLDEPTDVLTPQETENFFGVLERPHDEGYGVIIITHQLGEIMDISDRVTVLHDGRKVRSLVTEETMPEELSACMIGRGFKTEREIGESAAGETALSLKGVCLHKKHSTEMFLDHVNLTIRRGEIPGIAEVEGNGQKELAEVITGVRRIKSGQMEYQGKNIRKDSAKERFWVGISYISDDRHGDSLVMNMTVEDNLISRDFGGEPSPRKMVLDYRQTEKRAGEAPDRYGTKTSDKSGIKTPIKLMSDGNQQKAIFFRKISGKVDLIVVGQPTRGLDVGATRLVHETLLRQRNAGRYVLPISADLDKILGVSDRAAVMYEGRIIGVLNREEADVHKVGLLMGGIAKEAANKQEIRNI